MLSMVPVYNHAGTVAAVVGQLRALGATVLVVDDGSADGSGAAAAAAGAGGGRLAVNRGRGAALRRGIALAGGRGYTRRLTCAAAPQRPRGGVRARCARAA